MAYAEKNGEIHILSDGYSASALMNRNQWMVDHCDQLLACCNNVGQSGTASLYLLRADLRNKKLRIFGPIYQLSYFIIFSLFLVSSFILTLMKYCFVYNYMI